MGIGRVWRGSEEPLRSQHAHTCSPVGMGAEGGRVGERSARLGTRRGGAHRDRPTEAVESGARLKRVEAQSQSRSGAEHLHSVGQSSLAIRLFPVSLSLCFVSASLDNFSNVEKKKHQEPVACL